MKKKFSLKLLNLNQPKKQFRIWLMSISTAKSYILKAARKSDEMLEPYEWKRSRTVLRRESGRNPAYLVDYFELLHAVTDTIDKLGEAVLSVEDIYISEEEFAIRLAENPTDEDDIKE